MKCSVTFVIFFFSVFISRNVGMPFGFFFFFFNFFSGNSNSCKTFVLCLTSRIIISGTSLGWSPGGSAAISLGQLTDGLKPLPPSAEEARREETSRLCHSRLFIFQQLCGKCNKRHVPMIHYFLYNYDLASRC